MIIEQTPEITLAGVQAELLGISQILFGGIIRTKRHVKHRGGYPVIRYIVHILEHIGDAVADRFERILRLLAVLLLNGVIRDEEHNHAKGK
ncbi:hypothetical protein D3C71_1771030 [compost metagenome]